MPDTTNEPRLLLPSLQPFYDAVIPLAWPVVRIAVGWNLIVHGWGKIIRGPEAMAPLFSKMGFEPAVPIVLFLTVVEFGGGWCIALGLFTRFAAAAVAIEMAVITFDVYWPAGFAWLNRGYEYALMWGLVSFAIALRGGGPYSIDRWLGREL